MNKKLNFRLSLFGLAMAFATVYFIPSNIEPFCWLVIFIISAYLIARNCIARHFLHGVWVGVLNSVWITAVHILLFSTYISSHGQEAEAMQKLPFPDSPKLMMLITGPVVGFLSGFVLGLFAFVASKFVKPTTA